MDQDHIGRGRAFSRRILGDMQAPSIGEPVKLSLGREAAVDRESDGTRERRQRYYQRGGNAEDGWSRACRAQIGVSPTFGVRRSTAFRAAGSIG